MECETRKRVVSSCIPCYRRKQKCDRRYPCNHCTRRRVPEECIFDPTPAATTRSGSSSTENERAEENGTNATDHHSSQEVNGNNDALVLSTEKAARRHQRLNHGDDNTLPALFGYVEHSHLNSMALVHKLGSIDEQSSDKNPLVTPDVTEQVQKLVQRLPEREVIDFLVQHYVQEVHWMEQVVFTPWFLAQYKEWWTQGGRWSVFDVEFAILFLRICAYTSLFLPSPSYTIDHVRGIALADIRDTCQDTADQLAAVCLRLDARGSLVRVQHLSILGLQRQCEGRLSAFWDAIGDVARVAHRIGLHRGRSAWVRNMHEIDKEIRCRAFCNLYIWDSLLARHLDCPPFVTTSLTAEHTPHVHLSPPIVDPDVPEHFSARVMQARLASFWRCCANPDNSDYQPTLVEEQYEKFCDLYIKSLPPVFTLDPCVDWDERLPRLPLQRQILHIAIFESLCHHFRPALVHEVTNAQSLSEYKQVLLASQKRALAASALRTLDSVAKLHQMLGRSHVRLATIILPTFEAAVVLSGLLMTENFFPGTSVRNDWTSNVIDLDPLAMEKAQLTRDRCRHAIRDAQSRLEMLAEISNLAKAGADALARLVTRIPHSDESQWPALDLESYDPETFNALIAQGLAESFYSSAQFCRDRTGPEMITDSDSRLSMS